MVVTHDVNILLDGTVDGAFNVRQFDENSHAIIFHLPLTLTAQNEPDTFARLKLMPRGMTVPYLFDCTLDAQNVRCTPDNAAWQIAGEMYAQLEVYSTEMTVLWQSKLFILNVMASIDPTGGITPEKGQTWYDILNDAADEALDAAQEARASELEYTVEVDRIGIKNKSESEFTFTDHLTGPTGQDGAPGPKGDTGTGLDIRGTYPTLEDLQAAVPSPDAGWMYNVGTEAPFNIYMWDGVQDEWKDQGQLQGEPGPPGPNTITEATTTTLTGILKGNGGGVTIATAEDFASPPTTIPITLITTNWASDIYTIESEAITLDKNVTISLAENATPVQSVAWAAALPRSGELSAGSVTITSINPPSIDIPVVVRVESGGGFVRVENYPSDATIGAVNGIATLGPMILQPTWTTATLINGATASVSPALRYQNNIGGKGRLSGNVRANTVAFPVTVANIPKGLRPDVSHEFVVPVSSSDTGNVSAVIITFDTLGNIAFRKQFVGTGNAVYNYLINYEYTIGG